ncbi:hypothetical protein V2G26_017575 [Clonostachys chloroleuca]
MDVVTVRPRDENGLCCSLGMPRILLLLVRQTKWLSPRRSHNGTLLALSGADGPRFSEPFQESRVNDMGESLSLVHRSVPHQADSREPVTTLHVCCQILSPPLSSWRSEIPSKLWDGIIGSMQ